MKVDILNHARCSFQFREVFIGEVCVLDFTVNRSNIVSFLKLCLFKNLLIGLSVRKVQTLLLHME